MLVDDEKPILQNLHAVLPWADLDIEVVGLARNGVQALDIARRHRPDLILCDIRMPVMDGIEFLRRLRETDTEAEVVMLTGYQDFNYARSVIPYGVRDYVLKPIRYDELTALIERLSGAIRERKRARDSEQTRLDQAMHLAYEKMLHDLLTDNAPVPPQRWIDGEEPERWRFVMMLADVDGYAQRCRGVQERERKMWLVAARDALRDALAAEGLRHAVLPMREGEWCVLIERGSAGGGEAVPCGPLAPAGRDEAGMRVRAGRWAARLQEAVWSHAGLPLTVGIHPAEITIHELSRVFRSLQRTVHLAADRNRSVLWSGETAGEEATREELWGPVGQLVSALKRVDRDRVEEALRQLTARLQAESGRSLARAEKAAHFIALYLLREMRSLGALTAEQEDEIWRLVELADRVNEMLAAVRRIVELSLETSERQKTGERLMHIAKDYIDRNLSRDLGIDELAGHLGISASYFSLLFKQHFGVTFVEYVTSERVELAKSLLLLTDKSIADIGRSVGYAERRYFNKVFHKVTGELPSAYRERRKTTDRKESGTN
jgi:two-component system response regulator YesN